MTKVSPFLLRSSDSLENAIQVLNNSEHRVAIVVDSSSRILGTITDGDVRRALLAKVSLLDSLENVYHKNPVVAHQDRTSSEVLKLMRDNEINQIPIVDSFNRVIDIKSSKNIHVSSPVVSPVYLMAGGLGKRLRPLTNDIPKPMLEVNGIPILERIINQFKCHGFLEFYISTYYKSHVIKDYFGDGTSFGVKITYIDEELPLGTAGSLGLLAQNSISTPFIVMNGDLLTKADFRSLLDYHINHNSTATICVRDFEYQIPYGVINIGNDGLVSSISEKPIVRSFVSAGIYAFSPNVFEHINMNEYLDMPDLINRLIAEEASVSSFPIHEYWLDIGRHEQFNQAQNDAKLF